MLGRKISIRFRLHDDAAPFSEAVGVISAVTDSAGAERIEVMKRSGDVVSVDVPDIVAMKVFP